MKKYLTQAVACLLMLAGACYVVSCDDDSDSDTNNCPSERPYHCKTTKGCCKYKYYDGKNTCHSTLEGCVAMGNGCERCWAKDE